MIEGIRWVEEGEGHKVLYVKQDGDFVRYNVSAIAKPDYAVPGGSKGYSTAQYAIKAGYKYI